MEVRVTSVELQISLVCKTAGYKAIRAARVTIGGSKPVKSAATRGEVGRNFVNALGCVQRSVVTELLGFSHGRLWGTSVWLVSSGDAWICADLRLMSRVCLSLWMTQH